MDLRPAEARSVRATRDRTDQEVRRFMALALGLHFEMRFVDEARWWPEQVEDVARGLAPHYDNLSKCLYRMRKGEELGSRLSRYRIADTDYVEEKLCPTYGTRPLILPRAGSGESPADTRAVLATV
jgi:hypothetical protein